MELTRHKVKRDPVRYFEHLKVLGCSPDPNVVSYLNENPICIPGVGFNSCSFVIQEEKDVQKRKQAERQ